MTTTLDPMTFPLTGSQLIEASAGTGKTTAITNLYLRLVLGHGCEPLLPDRILVVTFTEAATQELRDRIRARLSQAAQAFRDGTEADAFLSALRADYPPESHAEQARALEVAAEWMDEAAVFTIHSWAWRMLREHAFASDTLFDQQLVTDTGPRLAEATRDYWRAFIAGLEPMAAQWLGSWCAHPDALQRQIRPLLARPTALATPLPPKEALTDAARHHAEWLQALKAEPWAERVADFREIFQRADAVDAFDRRKLGPKNVEGWLNSLEAWSAEADAVALELKKGWEALTPDRIHAAWKGDPALRDELAGCELLTELPALKTALDNPPDDGRGAVLAHAAQWIGSRFEAAQTQHAELGFDDLLTRLDRALQGPGAKTLAGMIRAQYPVVLIDEFQDTDPTQYRIFDAVYDIAGDHAQTAVVMIGDPKQAIYAFRGADIHTYLKARSACAGRLHTLAVNYRAAGAMVAGVNRLFAPAEERSGAGAFRFRRGEDNPLPFAPATAAGRNEVFVVGGVALDDREAPALQLWQDATLDDGKGLPGVGEERWAIAEAFASRLVEWLNAADRGEVGFRNEAGVLRPLTPGDIAVLVNQRAEAEIIRAAMRRRGLRSVYLSDRDSVYGAPQAAEIALWLQAAAEPDQVRAVRSALATASIGLSAAELEQLSLDESLLEQRIEQFRGYRLDWQRRGVLPMIRRLLDDFDIPARLLGDETLGERALTDILHIAELLQAASRGLEGEHALLRYLLEQIQANEEGTAVDVPSIRLESDAHLVQVVTVHKSKGLQYPLVFLPFAADYRSIKNNAGEVLRWHDEQGQLQLSASGGLRAMAGAREARLAEDLRKLYVAVTRAQFATFVGVAPRKRLDKSALGYLLSAFDPEAPPVIEPAPAITTTRLNTRDEPLVNAAARDYTGGRRPAWWIGSYSGLRDRRGGLGSEAVSREAMVLEEEAAIVDAAAGRGAADEPSAHPFIHEFPRGAATGSFLHDCLEWACNRGFSALLADPAALRDLVARRCQVRGWESYIDPLTDWLLRVMQTPLPLPGSGDDSRMPLQAAELASAELEFTVGVARADIQVIDQAITAHTLDGLPRPAIAPGRLNGMLKGFIDLVFLYEGRYYVADYKSNALGESDADYTEAAMRAAILGGRYDLQYSLYLLALHRLLSVRLPDYDYDRHVGGALSIFLRGIDGEQAGVHAERPPRALIETLDREFQP